MTPAHSGVLCLGDTKASSELDLQRASQERLAGVKPTVDIPELRLHAELLAAEVAAVKPELRAEERRGACELLAAFSGWDAALLLAAAGPTFAGKSSDDPTRLLLVEAARTIHDAP